MSSIQGPISSVRLRGNAELPATDRAQPRCPFQSPPQQDCYIPPAPSDEGAATAGERHGFQKSHSPTSLASGWWKTPLRSYLRRNHIEERHIDFVEGALADYLVIARGFTYRLWSRLLSSVIEKGMKALEPALREEISEAQVLKAIIAFLPQIGAENERMEYPSRPISNPELIALLSARVAEDYLRLFPQRKSDGSAVPVVDELIQRLVRLHCSECAEFASALADTHTREQLFDSSKGIVLQFNEKMTDRGFPRGASAASLAASALPGDPLFPTAADSGQATRDALLWRAMVMDHELGIGTYAEKIFELSPRTRAALSALALEYGVQRIINDAPLSVDWLARAVVEEAVADFPELADQMVAFHLNILLDWLIELIGSLPGQAETSRLKLHRIATSDASPAHSADEIIRRANLAADHAVFVATERLSLARRMLGLDVEELDLHAEAQRAFDSREARKARAAFGMRMSRERGDILVVSKRIQDLSDQLVALYVDLGDVRDSTSFDAMGLDDILSRITAAVSSMTREKLTSFIDGLYYGLADIAKLRESADELELARSQIVPNQSAFIFSDASARVWLLNKRAKARLSAIDQKLTKAEHVMKSALAISEERLQSLSKAAFASELPVSARIEIEEAGKLSGQLASQLAEFESLKAMTVMLADNGRLMAASILLIGADVAAFERAVLDAHTQFKSAEETGNGLREFDKTSGAVLDASGDSTIPAPIWVQHDALCETMQGLSTELAAPILQAIDRLESASRRTRRARTEIDDLIDGLGLSLNAIENALMAAESGLPIADAARIPRVKLRLKPASGETYEFKPSIPGSELTDAQRRIFDQVMHGRILSLTLRKESYLLSRSQIDNVQRWMKDRSKDLIAMDIFGNLIPLPKWEYGVRLAQHDELPEAHPLRTLLVHLANAISHLSEETDLLIFMMKAGSSKELSRAAIEQRNPNSPGALLRTLFAWMARSPSPLDADHSRLIVRRWAVTHRQAILMAGDGEAAKHYIERTKAPAKTGQSGGKSGENLTVPAAPATSDSNAMRQHFPAADARPLFEEIGATDVASEDMLVPQRPADPPDAIVDPAADEGTSQDEDDVQLRGASVALSSTIPAR